MNGTTEYLKINLLYKYFGDTEKLYREQFESYKPKIKGFKDNHEGYKIGDVIEFVAGYNYDILYTTEILGFDQDGDIYLLWDCYWSPIRLSDPNRKIRKV